MSVFHRRQVEFTVQKAMTTLSQLLTLFNVKRLSYSSYYSSPSPFSLYLIAKNRRQICSKMSAESSPKLAHSINLPSHPAEPVQIVAAPGVSESEFRWVHSQQAFLPNWSYQLFNFLFLLLFSFINWSFVGANLCIIWMSSFIY